jgi:phosphohistidine swiveling domain-containing protein
VLERVNPMSPFVLPFDALTEADAARVGNKGLRLAEMAQAGLPVLPGFCVTTAAYRAFLSTNGLKALVADTSESIYARAETIRQYLVNSPPGGLPAAVVESVTESYRVLGSPVVAVRSSATLEDHHGASFAGQYDTFLNVTGIEEVLQKIQACWAGLWGERALAYMREQGADPLQADMGVVIQVQGRAQAAGVLFTLNPTSGHEAEMMVEAVWGLGEAVVSGRVTPDRYVVNVLDSTVVTRDIANQAVIMVAAESGGMEEQPLSVDQHDQSVLSDEQLLKLTELGRRVQLLYGYPQDIEWALVNNEFVLLQTRPLTSFSFDPNIGQWTSGNYREVLPGFASPLALSLSLEHDYGRGLSSVFRDLKMGDVSADVVWGRPFFGRAYWNVGITKQLNALVPGFKERVFDRTVGIEPTYEGDGLVTPWSPRTILRALPILFALQRCYRKIWREGRSYRDRFYREIEPKLDAVDVQSLDDDELADHCRYMAELHWEANGTAIRVSLMSTQAQDEFEPMVRRINVNLPAERQVVEGDLITGLSDVRTAQPTLKLWELARHALENPEVAKAVLEGDPNEMPTRLQQTVAGEAYWWEVEDYVRRYRYMAPIDEDLIQPRWDEDPGLVLSLLQSYAQADESMDPSQRLEKQRRIRRAAERRVLKILSRGWRRLWWFGRRSFINHLRLVRRYVWWREETRVVAARAFYQCRRFYLELGRRWAVKGILDEAQHVFLIRWPAIKAVLDGDAPASGLRQQVDDYLHLKESYRNFEPPNVIGRGASIQNDLHYLKSSQHIFTGIPCSSGIAEGVARVVENVEEARELRRGEILVARYTNPSWTPIFNLAGGIVIEEGGLLSHGAVVAREYGIPAVLRIQGATRIFRSGQMLRIDGSRGTVEILIAEPVTETRLRV